MFGHIVLFLVSTSHKYHCIIISHHLICPSHQSIYEIGSCPFVSAAYRHLQVMYPFVSSTNLGPCPPMNLDDVHGPKHAFADTGQCLQFKLEQLHLLMHFVAARLPVYC